MIKTTKMLRFGPQDRLTLDGKEVINHEVHGDRHVLTLDMGDGRTRSLDRTDGELRHLCESEVLRVQPSFYGEAQTICRAQYGERTTLDSLGRQQDRALRMHAICKDMEEIRSAEGMKLTEAGLMVHLPELAKRDLARQLATAGKAGRKDHRRKRHELPCSRTLLENFRRYRRAEGDVRAFVNSRRPNPMAVTAETLETKSLAHIVVAGYASPQKPSRKKIIEDVQIAFRAENEKRTARGANQMVIPSERTLHRMITALDPFATCVRREGKAAALKKFGSSGGGLKIVRPLERVEIDECKLDFMALLTRREIIEMLPADALAKVPKGRLWLVAVIDVATRCILGIAVTEAPNARAAKNALRMATVDKSAIARACGATFPWNQYGVPRLIACDNGTAFKSDEFKLAVEEAGMDLQYTPAKAPNLRPFVERFFGTMNAQVSQLVLGRTGSSVKDRGEEDPAAQACLTKEDVFQILGLLIADRYHQSPHKGLDGRTPAEAWAEMQQHPEWFQSEMGPEKRRRAFGFLQEGRIGQAGITQFGIIYTNPRIQELRADGFQPEVKVLVDPGNLGAISVHLDGQWETVRARDPEMVGRSLADWQAEQKIRRLRSQAGEERTRKARESALRAIESLVAQRAREVGVAAMDYTEEEIARARKELRLGLGRMDRGPASLDEVSDPFQTLTEIKEEDTDLERFDRTSRRQDRPQLDDEEGLI